MQIGIITKPLEIKKIVKGAFLVLFSCLSFFWQFALLSELILFLSFLFSSKKFNFQRNFHLHDFISKFHQILKNFLDICRFVHHSKWGGMQKKTFR